MSSQQTRRKFLKDSAVGLSLAATAGLRSAAAAVNTGHVEVRVTGGKFRYATASLLDEKSPAAQTAVKAGDNVITIDPEKRFQEILGFGGAMTDAACYTFNRLDAPDRDRLFHELFHPSEMGFSVCRTCIGASDYSTEVFSYDEGEPDPEMQRFSIAHDRPYVIPMLRQARQANPDLFLFSSPWSPPGWMKAGGSMLGGSIRPRFFRPYAQYFLKFLQAYAVEGVPVQAVTVQNEVDTDQDGRMPACTWAQEYEMQFVKDHLGPLLQHNGLNTKIWILDHNYNLWGRAVAELDDSAVRKFCNEVAFHGYVGTPDMMTRLHQAYPDARIYWTEGGPDYTQPDYLTDWVNWGRTFTQVLRNWSRSITAWNLALDEKGRPNIGPFSCGGVVTIHSQTKEITRSGQYWAFAHFSRAIHRGAHRVDTHGGVMGVEDVAFQNPDGQRVLVLTNSGPFPRTVLVKEQGKSTQSVLALEPDSVTTVSWS